jgi:hypothetical protein
MLNKLLPVLNRSIFDKVSRLDTLPLCFDGFRWSMVLLCDFVANADDCAVWRVFGEVVVEIFQCSIGGLRVEEVDHRNEDEVEDGEHLVR